MFKNNCTNYVAYIYHVARLTPKPDSPPLFCERLSVSRGHREDWRRWEDSNLLIHLKSVAHRTDFGLVLKFRLHTILTSY